MYDAFQTCRRDWISHEGPGPYEDGFGIDERDDVDSPAGFHTWIHRMLSQVHPVGTPCPDRPHWSPRWVVENGQVLGGFAVRHQYDDRFGWIGYGIRPSARRRGVATWALRATLDECREQLGVNRALMTCRADNSPSARTIERCGGVLEGIVETPTGPVRRYWIALA
jgi:predicted acetyltransferase